MSGWPHPAYVIETPRLIIRCYERADVEPAHACVLANLDALRPWMPWIASEPLDLADRGEVIRRFRGQFDLGQDFVYGVFDPSDGRLIGGCGLHPRTTPGALEIGYWITHERWGEGLATEAASALTRVGFERMGAVRMEIRVDPKNARSRAIPVKLGYREEGTLRGVCHAATSGHSDAVVYGMLRQEFQGTPSSSIELRTARF